MDPVVMRRRVEEVLDALGIAHLRHRSPATLSGGERQRAAVAGALATAPEVLVLDEPTSELDPQGADDVLAAVARLNADLGTTVLLAEHRLERAAPLADHAVRIDAGATPPACRGRAGAGHLRRGAPGHPPRPPAWAGTLRRSPCATPAAGPRPPCLPDRAVARPRPRPPASRCSPGEASQVRHGERRALQDVDLDVRQGEVVALLGRNGSGKTTLLRALAGLLEVDRGRVEAAARSPTCPRTPTPCSSPPPCGPSCEHTLRLLGRRDPEAVATWLDRARPRGAGADRHPRTLSAGQRQRVAIAAVAVGGARGLLLDEPTRGIDPPSRRRPRATP